MLQLNATIKQWGNEGFIGNVHEMKGVVVHSDWLEGAMNEILISVRVKLAYDSGLDINKVITVDPKTEKTTFKLIEANNYMFAL